MLNEMKKAAGRGDETALEVHHKLDEINSKYVSNELLLEDSQKGIEALKKTILENNEASIKEISELKAKVIFLEMSLEIKYVVIKDKDHSIEEHKNILRTHKKKVEELREECKLKERKISDIEEKLMEEFKGKAELMDELNNLSQDVEEAKLIALERGAQLSALNQAFEENLSRSWFAIPNVSEASKCT